MKVAILVAMDKEYELLSRLFETGFSGPNAIVLDKCGIGKVNAAIGATQLLAREKPDCLISTGVAGGLDPSIKTMDVVLAREVAFHDAWYGVENAYGQVQGCPPRFAAPEALLKAARETGYALKEGLICSGDWFVSGREDAARIRAHFPEALAVDMESGALAQTCWRFGVPFMSLRVISDASGDDHETDYNAFWADAPLHSFEVLRSFLNNLPESIQ